MRKRHEKARTGCQTCKLRKIKCDEGRPSCRRCMISKRECQGYKPAPVGNFSWQQLLQRRQPCLSIDAADNRCLSYYHRVVAPSLARSLDDTFWVVHVPQVFYQEPAARHAVLAISALHEDFSTTLPSRVSGHLDGLTGFTGRLQRNSDISSRYASALQHYNSAIRMVLEDRIADVETLMTVSLLFTCIELLQGSTDAAARHCQHGVQLYNKCQLPTELSVTFNHLAFFLNTFGTFDTEGLPQVAYPQGDTSSTVVDEMRTVIQACQALDTTLGRGARLLQHVVRSQQDNDSLYSAQDLKNEQFLVHRALSLWWEGFVALRRQLQSTSSVHESDAAALRLLETRWLVSKVLLSTCLADNEYVFDEYTDQFQRIIDLAEQEKAARSASVLPLPSFSFDMGYLPLLHIVGTKCRQLRLRVRALVLMKDLSAQRETIWDACIIYATVVWAIEFEHGITLDEKSMRSTTNPYSAEQLPSDAPRLVEFSNTDEASLGVDSEGHAVVRRRVCYRTSGPDGVLGPFWDSTTMRI